VGALGSSAVGGTTRASRTAGSLTSGGVLITGALASRSVASWAARRALGGTGILVAANAGALGRRPTSTVALFSITTRSTTFARVRHHDVGTFLRLLNEFEALVARIDGRRRLGSGHREHFNTLHVLLNVGAIDVTYLGSTGNERDRQDTLGKLGARGAPRGEIAVHTRNFDLNTSRHRFLIY
jgi:hypothetical protein